MKNIALIIAYDGTDFLGWQKTKMGPSIEEALESSLQQILQEKITLQAASRTDARVHAEGQVINFYTSKESCLQKLKNSLNQLLPKSIKVLDVKRVGDNFHPTLDVLKKTYVYRICYGPVQLPEYRFFSWHVPYMLNLPEMKKAAEYLKGTHDFKALCNSRNNLNYRDYTRTLFDVNILEKDIQRLQVEVTGNHFLYKMVRNLVGLLVYVGREKIAPGAVLEIIAAKKRTFAAVTAPAHGLSLKKIFYPTEKEL